MTRRRHVTDAGKAPSGLVPSPRMLRDLDQYASEIVNGDEGGTWNPARPITLGGALAAQIELTTTASLISGDVETIRGNSRGAQSGLQIAGGATPSWPAFQSARTRTYHVPFDRFQEERGPLEWAQPIYEFDPLYLAPRRVRYSASGTVATHILSVHVPSQGAIAGSTIAEVRFRYLVTKERVAATLPVTYPRVRVVRLTGITLVALHDATGGYDSDGWLADAPADEDEYNNLGLPREVVYVPNQNNTAIDPNQYFLLQVMDEDSLSADLIGNVFLGATLSLTNLTHLVLE